MSGDDRDSRLSRTVVLLGLTSLFTDVGTEMIFPLLPVFLAEVLHAGPEYIGLVEGVAVTVASMLKLASGVVADIVPRRKPLVLFGYGLASAVRPFVALATHPWHVLAVRVADRIGKGIRGSPRDALIADAAGDRPGRAFGFNQAMDNAGAVVGPLLATLAVALGFSMREVFWIAVIPGAVATTLVALIREEPVTRATPKSALPAKTPGDRPGSVLSPTLTSFLAIMGVFALSNSSDAFLLLRARSLGVSTAAIPILWSALNASKVLWAWLGGRWADRFSRPRLVAAGWLVYALVYVGLGMADTSWQVWALFVLYGVFYGLTEPVEKALLKDLVRPEQRGRAYGAFNFIEGIAALPAGLLTGYLWHVWSPSAALELGAAMAGLAGVMLLVWDVWRRSNVAGKAGAV
jgi:MFS family permease